MDPFAARLERLLRHVRQGWATIRASEARRREVARWLEEHPAGWEPVQRAWVKAVTFDGDLAAWLDEGADASAWTSELPLHSVLTSHPFAALSPWPSLETSSES